MSANKVQFILNHLKVLSKSLYALGVPLFIREAPYFSDCANLLKDICKQYSIESIFFNKEYPIDEKKRDLKVERVLGPLGLQIFSFHDSTLMRPGAILTNDGNPIKIYTPFKKKCLQEIFKNHTWQSHTQPLPPLAPLTDREVVPTHCLGFTSSLNIEQLWPAGEFAAKTRLEYFCNNLLANYTENRNIPSLDGTSKLSPYLAIGSISARQCITAVMQTVQLQDISQLDNFLGASTWISELIWREFYLHLIDQYPRINYDKAFRPNTEHIPWDNNPRYFEAWCQGQTGYPIIDAAMRQLNQTGWMHNRLRMLVASFLTKTLFIDWRWGEHYFSEQLIDWDFSANNGNWQWSASTGTDAVPYFRIFNPNRQSAQFDPKGSFIKEFCPELSNLENQELHDLSDNPQRAQELGYPTAILPLTQKRDQVLAAFKATSQRTSD